MLHWLCRERKIDWKKFRYALLSTWEESCGDFIHFSEVNLPSFFCYWDHVTWISMSEVLKWQKCAYPSWIRLLLFVLFKCPILPWSTTNSMTAKYMAWCALELIKFHRLQFDGFCLQPHPALDSQFKWYENSCYPCDLWCHKVSYKALKELKPLK